MTRERPIFSPSRRPPPPAMPTLVAPVAVRSPPKPKEPDRPAITLLGTILGSAENIGVFFNPATRDIVRLRVGEDHEGWALLPTVLIERRNQLEAHELGIELQPKLSRA